MKPNEAVQVVALPGDLDVFSVARAWDTIHGLPGRPGPAVEVNLSDAADFDPSGLQLLLALRRSCRERNLPLGFRGLPQAWSERIAALGASRFFEEGTW